MFSTRLSTRGCAGYAVVSLLEAVGSVTEQPHGKVAIVVGSEAEYFDPPARKDIDAQAVVNLRRMLSKAGYGLEPGKSDSAAEADGPGR